MLLFGLFPEVAKHICGNKNIGYLLQGSFGFVHLCISLLLYFVRRVSPCSLGCPGTNGDHPASISSAETTAVFLHSLPPVHFLVKFFPLLLPFFILVDLKITCMHV